MIPISLLTTFSSVSQPTSEWDEKDLDDLHRILPNAGMTNKVPIVHRPYTEDGQWNPAWGEDYIKRMEEYFIQNVNTSEGSFVVAEYFGFKDRWTKRMDDTDKDENSMERTYALLCMKNKTFVNTKDAPVGNLSFWEGQHRYVANTTVACNSSINYSTGTLRPPGEKRDWQPWIYAGSIAEDDSSRQDITTHTEDWIYGSNKLDHVFAMEVRYYCVPPSQMTSKDLNSMVCKNSWNLRKKAQVKALPQPFSKIATCVKGHVEKLSARHILADLEPPSEKPWLIEGMSFCPQANFNKKMKLGHGNPQMAFDTFPILDDEVVQKYMRMPNDPVVSQGFKDLFHIKLKDERGDIHFIEPPFVTTLQGLLTSEDKGSRFSRISLEMVNAWYWAPLVVHALMEQSVTQQDGDITQDKGVYQTVDFLMKYVLSMDDSNQGKVLMHAGIKLYDQLPCTTYSFGENYLIGAATFIISAIGDIFHRRVNSTKSPDPVRGSDGYWKAEQTKSLRRSKRAIMEKLQRFYDAIPTAYLVNSHRSFKEHMEALGESFISTLCHISMTLFQLYSLSTILFDIKIHIHNFHIKNHPRSV